MKGGNIIMLYETYKEIKRNMNCFIVGQTASRALELTRAVLLAKELGLQVEWDCDDWFTLGDQGDYISDEQFECGLTSGRYEVLVGRVEGYNGSILAALGSVLVDYNQNDWQEYLEGFEAELLAEAIAELKKS
jgi:hypothetical protein